MMYLMHASESYMYSCTSWQKASKENQYGMICLHLVQYCSKVSYQSQRAKKVMSDSPGLVDFAIGLVDSDHQLARRTSEVFWELK